MKNHLILPICIAAALTMTACSSNDAQRAAEDMLVKAEKYFSEGSYDRAKIAIDSLRKVYPGAVETRKKALKLFQDISLKEAQEDLALTDSIMQKVGLDYKYHFDKKWSVEGATGYQTGKQQLSLYAKGAYRESDMPQGRQGGI